MLFSSDVYAYAAYGELARLGADPYAHAAPSLANDALISAAAWQWSGTLPICVYGPAFVALAKAIVVLLAPLGMLAQLNGLRAASSAAFLLCGPLAFAAYTGSRTARLRSVATILLNPAAIWCAAEGHNDAIALCVVLAGFALVRRRLDGAGAAVAALAALIKLPGRSRRSRTRAGRPAGPHRRRRRPGDRCRLLHSALCRRRDRNSRRTAITPRKPRCRRSLRRSAQRWRCRWPRLRGAALVAAGIRRLRREQPDGWLWLGLGAWVLIPNPYPWYGLWLLALAAMAPQSRAGRAAVLLSLTSLLRYAPDAIALPPAGAQIALGLLAILPLVALLPRRRLRFFARPVIMSDP